MEIISTKKIENRILTIRGQSVLVDSDLAELYGIETKALNQAVKRNNARFPADFMFKLTKEEKEELVTDCDHLTNLKYSAQAPYAFTEHGALMLANVLHSEQAINVSIQIIRAFLALRNIFANFDDLNGKLKSLEKKYDKRFKIVFEVLKNLVNYKLMPGKNRRIGFQT